MTKPPGLPTRCADDEGQLRHALSARDDAAQVAKIADVKNMVQRRKSDGWMLTRIGRKSP
jgi:hypothetical protein